MLLAPRQAVERLSAEHAWEDAHPASALGAVVHGPLVVVLVDNAIVEADATADVDAGEEVPVLVSLQGREGRERGSKGRGGELIMRVRQD